MSAAITHAMAAMAGGFLAIAAYAVVKVGSDQERRHERRRGVERLLLRFADVCKLDNRPIRLDVAHYAELIMREVDR